MKTEEKKPKQQARETAPETSTLFLISDKNITKGRLRYDSQ